MAAKQQHRLEVGDEGFSQGPERQCAVTRASCDANALIRFVASPSGDIVPDLDRSLPGRGVWLTGQKAIVEKAIASKAFSKSLKANVRAADDMAERVDSLLLRRVQDALALANKAGLVVMGFGQVDEALDKPKVSAAVAVLVHGSDAAEDGQGKLSRKFEAIQRAKGASAPICRVLTVEQLSLALGRGSVVHAGLLPGGLTERFLRDAERLGRYRAISDASDQAFLHSSQRKVER